MAFDIGEGLAKQRFVAEVFAPVSGEGFDAVGEGLAGEIGTLGHPAHGKAHVIDHQIAAARTGQAVFAQSLKAFKFSTMACEENEPCETIITPPKRLDIA